MMSKLSNKASREDLIVIWFSRIFRWGLGLAFVWTGVHYDGAWPAILFGVAIAITGFFRPTRCMDETCQINGTVGEE